LDYASCKGVFRTQYIPAGTAFSGSGGAGKPAPLSFHQWTTLASARMLQALQKPATSTLSP